MKEIKSSMTLQTSCNIVIFEMSSGNETRRISPDSRSSEYSVIRSRNSNSQEVCNHCKLGEVWEKLFCSYLTHTQSERLKSLAGLQNSRYALCSHNPRTNKNIRDNSEKIHTALQLAAVLVLFSYGFIGFA